MQHKALIAIAVGSILGTGLSKANADEQQPAAAPSQSNQQQAAPAAAVGINGQAAAPQNVASGLHHSTKHWRELARCLLCSG